MNTTHKLLISGAVLLTSACAGAPAPTERLATATASVRAAQEVGAANVPQAELHLRLAQEQVEKARALMKDDENESADRMLRRAAADAELALAMARESASRESAIQAEQNAGAVSIKTTPNEEAQAVH